MIDINKIERDEHGRFAKGTIGGPGRHKLKNTASDMLRFIFDEEDELLQGTNLETAVRNLVERAKKDTNAFFIATNKAYGKDADIIHFGTEEELDLGKLSDEELEQYEALVEKMVNESDPT